MILLTLDITFTDLYLVSQKMSDMSGDVVPHLYMSVIFPLFKQCETCLKKKLDDITIIIII